MPCPAHIFGDWEEAGGRWLYYGLCYYPCLVHSHYQKTEVHAKQESHFKTKVPSMQELSKVFLCINVS